MLTEQEKRVATEARARRKASEGHDEEFRQRSQDCDRRMNAALREKEALHGPSLPAAQPERRRRWHAQRRAQTRRPRPQSPVDRPRSRVAEMAPHFKILGTRDQWVFTCRLCGAAWEVRRETDASGRAAPDISKGAYGSLREHALKATRQHRIR